MKHKRAYIVMAINEDGGFEEHPNFEGREFTSPQGVLQEITDTEQRISGAIGDRQIPKEEDQEYIKGLEGTEIVILETFAFGDLETKPTPIMRKIVEPVDLKGAQATMDRALAAMRKELDQLKKENADIKKQLKKPTT